MSTSLNNIPIGNAATGTNGAYMQVTTLTVPATGTILIPAGIWMTPGAANVTIQVQTSTAGTWTPVSAAAGTGTFFSDGVNLRASNSSTAVALVLYGPGSAATAGSPFNFCS